jgi:hypothetical protein
MISYNKRIKRGYGLSVIRNNRELLALMEFCRNSLRDKKDNFMITNNKHCWVWLVTLKLYGNRCEEDLILIDKFNPERTMYYDVIDFIESHAGWYWS